MERSSLGIRLCIKSLIQKNATGWLTKKLIHLVGARVILKIKMLDPIYTMPVESEDGMKWKRAVLASRLHDTIPVEFYVNSIDNNNWRQRQ